MAHRAPPLPDPVREAYDEVISPARPDKMETTVQHEFPIEIERVPRSGDRADRIEFTVPEESENDLRRMFGQTTDQIDDESSESVLGFLYDDAQSGGGEVVLYLGRDKIMMQVV